MFTQSHFQTHHHKGDRVRGNATKKVIKSASGRHRATGNSAEVTKDRVSTSVSDITKTNRYSIQDLTKKDSNSNYSNTSTRSGDTIRLVSKSSRSATRKVGAATIQINTLRNLDDHIGQAIPIIETQLRQTINERRSKIMTGSPAAADGNASPITNEHWIRVDSSSSIWCHQRTDKSDQHDQSQEFKPADDIRGYEPGELGVIVKSTSGDRVLTREGTISVESKVSEWLFGGNRASNCFDFVRDEKTEVRTREPQRRSRGESRRAQISKQVSIDDTRIRQSSWKRDRPSGADISNNLLSSCSSTCSSWRAARQTRALLASLVALPYHIGCGVHRLSKFPSVNTGSNVRLVSAFCINFFAYQLETLKLLAGCAFDQMMDQYQYQSCTSNQQHQQSYSTLCRICKSLPVYHQPSQELEQQLYNNNQLADCNVSGNHIKSSEASLYAHEDPVIHLQPEDKPRDYQVQDTPMTQPQITTYSGRQLPEAPTIITYPTDRKELERHEVARSLPDNRRSYRDSAIPELKRARTRELQVQNNDRCNTDPLDSNVDSWIQTHDRLKPPKVSSNNGRISLKGARKRLGFTKKETKTLSVNRSEEVVPLQSMTRYLSSSFTDSGNETGSCQCYRRAGWVDSGTDFVQGMGVGQIALRQALVSPYLGDIQLSICDIRGMLEVEVIQVKGLPPKSRTCQPPVPYVKVYLMRGKKCLAKFKVKSDNPTLQPVYQKKFIFREHNYVDCVLQVIVWGDYGKEDRKSLMGIVQIHLNDIDVSNTALGWYKLFNIPAVMKSLLSSKALRQRLCQ